MQKNNPLYKNQGAHVIVCLLTVDDNKFKVLLIKRKNQPFENYWSLLGGAVYNNESLETAISRELDEKCGISKIKPSLFKIYSNVERAKESGFRMFGLAYLALVDASAITFIKNSEKASEVCWFEIESLPNLAYDHNTILSDAIDFLKNQICKNETLKMLFPDYVTISELQNVFETILKKKFDRRNFRKKMLSIGLLKDTGTEKTQKGRKPCKLYKIETLEKNFFV